MTLFTFDIHRELIPLLQPFYRNRTVQVDVRNPQSFKHIIEGLGIPHTEIGEIWLDGERIQPGLMSTACAQGGRLQVFPVVPLSQPVNDPRFVLDNHLGRLAVGLRILGWDTLYRNDYQDEELALLSSTQQRILLTRDKRLLMRKQVERGAWIRSQAVNEQVRQVITRFGLARSGLAFQRCPRCNTALHPVDKADILERLEPLTRRYYSEFRQCGGCGQIYWKGSHYEHMLATIAGWKQNA